MSDVRSTLGQRKTYETVVAHSIYASGSFTLNYTTDEITVTTTLSRDCSKLTTLTGIES